ncbi:2-keto-4-pentenoate hydratase [Tardiphaga sp. 803_E3_N1_3]|uniref:2-keto-4-pentenoate hydratase n=1 Tax=Tardiphaga sp. 803_E3_N1_3 TaxID=3240785 RepID=UPI003F261C78
MPTTNTASNHKQYEQLAVLLADARRDVRQIGPLPEDLVPDTIAAAYTVNEDVARRLGWEPLGWKIAGTTADVQTKMKIDHPIYGRTYRRFACSSPARIRHSELLDPIVECEFFVTLAKDLSARDAPWTMPEVVDAIANVHAGIEVAECRYPMKALPALPAILADGSASGRYVAGSPIKNWREGLGNIAVTLEIDGVVKRRGLGSDVMGDPLAPMLWLLEERRRRGDGLKAGETISTGSMTGMLLVRAGQHARARFGDEAEVEITFDA